MTVEITSPSTRYMANLSFSNTLMAHCTPLSDCYINVREDDLLLGFEFIYSPIYTTSPHST